MRKELVRTEIRGNDKVSLGDAPDVIDSQAFEQPSKHQSVAGDLEHRLLGDDDVNDGLSGQRKTTFSQYLRAQIGTRPT